MDSTSKHYHRATLVSSRGILAWFAVSGRRVAISGCRFGSSRLEVEKDLGKRNVSWNAMAGLGGLFMRVAPIS